MKRGYVDTPEGQIHYRTDGSGEPLLLIHRVGLSSDEFSEMIPLLGKRRQVFAPDLPGYGSSYLPAQPYQITDYARSVGHFLDALKIDNIDVVGVRLGGTIAVEMETSHPERINRLVIIGFIYPDAERQKYMLNLSLNRYMKIKEDGSHLAELWQMHYARSYTDLEMCQRAVVDNLKSGLGAREEDAHVALYRYDIEPKLPGVKSPVLLLNGGTDPYLGRLKPIMKLIPRCQTKTIEGTLHIPTWEKPEEFAQAILEYLDNSKQ